MGSATTSLTPYSFLLGNYLVLKRSIDMEDVELREDEDIKNTLSVPDSV